MSVRRLLRVGVTVAFAEVITHPEDTDTITNFHQGGCRYYWGVSNSDPHGQTTTEIASYQRDRAPWCCRSRNSLALRRGVVLNDVKQTNLMTRNQNGSRRIEFNRRKFLKTATVAGAGASGVTALSGEVAAHPQGCDVLVDPNDSHAQAPTIQGGVDAASSGNGDTVCVVGGTYSENVTINKKDVTLQGIPEPQSSDPVVLDGQITVESGGDDTTIRRFNISPSGTFPGGTSPDPAGVLVKADNVTVENNVIEEFQADLSNGNGSFTMHGVQVFGQVSNATVRDNVIRGFESQGDPTTWPKYGESRA